MTLAEARERIGAGVVYTPKGGGRREDGVITSVGSTFVFVRYTGDSGSKATDPADLVPLAPRRSRGEGA
jgi:hypothetical protein